MRNYTTYKEIVLDKMEGNAVSYHKCIKNGWVVEKEKINCNGNPYRMLTEEEFNNKFKIKK